MPVVAVVNRKGGSGKSTLATHLAAYCAHNGIPVMLGDVDNQQSDPGLAEAARRASRRPRAAPIVGWTVDPRSVLRAPSGVTHVVLDTPGGLRGFDLARVVMSADVILMPVCNSVFDRESAADCYAELKTLPRVASGRCQVAAIGMRLDARTKADEVLKDWADKQKLALHRRAARDAGLRALRRARPDAVRPAAPPRSQADLVQWQPILTGWSRCCALWSHPLSPRSLLPPRRHPTAHAPTASSRPRPRCWCTAKSLSPSRALPRRQPPNPRRRGPAPSRVWATGSNLWAWPGCCSAERPLPRRPAPARHQRLAQRSSLVSLVPSKLRLAIKPALVST